MPIFLIYLIEHYVSKMRNYFVYTTPTPLSSQCYEFISIITYLYTLVLVKIFLIESGIEKAKSI